jgi:hypothetical protein
VEVLFVALMLAVALLIAGLAGMAVLRLFRSPS